jgi:hypothetical protein
VVELKGDIISGVEDEERQLDFEGECRVNFEEEGETEDTDRENGLLEGVEGLICIILGATEEEEYRDLSSTVVGEVRAVAKTTS